MFIQCVAFVYIFLSLCYFFQKYKKNSCSLLSKNNLLCKKERKKITCREEKSQTPPPPPDINWSIPYKDLCPAITLLWTSVEINVEHSNKNIELCPQQSHHDCLVLRNHS